MRIFTLLEKMVLWGVVVGVMGNACFGQTCWKRTLGLGGIIQDVLPIQDGNFLLVGEGNPITSNNIDGWFLKINAHGDILWTKTYGETEERDDCIYNIVPTTDGNFLLRGTTGLPGPTKSCC